MLVSLQVHVHEADVDEVYDQTGQLLLEHDQCQPVDHLGEATTRLVLFSVGLEVDDPGGLESPSGQQGLRGMGDPEALGSQENAGSLEGQEGPKGWEGTGSL